MPIEVRELFDQAFEFATCHFGKLGVVLVAHLPRFVEFANDFFVTPPNSNNGAKRSQVFCEFLETAGLTRDVGVGELPFDLPTALIGFGDAFEILGH